MPPKIQEVDASKQTTEHVYIPAQNDRPFSADWNPDQKPENYDQMSMMEKKMHDDWDYKPGSISPTVSKK